MLMSTHTPDLGAPMAHTSNVAIYSGSSVSIMSAIPLEATAQATVVDVAVIAGLTVTEWQILGVAGGLLLGLAGFGINVWFKIQHLQVAKKAAKKGFAAPDE